MRYGGARTAAQLAFLPERTGDGGAPTDAPSSDPIDGAIDRKLARIECAPAGEIDDSGFLRRVHLLTIGALPTPDETRRFLASKETDKRVKLVASLVGRPEFAEFWALKWADLLRNETKTMGAKGAWALQRWLVEQTAADLPLDRFAAELVAGRGSTWANPPASFHRTNRDPTICAESVGQVFLGYRIQCARCHNHPFDQWTQDDYYGFAACFASVKRKPRDEFRKDKLDVHEINGDEIIYVAGPAEIAQPTSGRRLSAKPLGGALPPAAAGEQDELDRTAAWLGKDPQFARNFANRAWYHLFGRGVVDPPDDFRGSNPPVNAELLEALRSELVGNGMRLRPLLVRILGGKAFSRSAATGGGAHPLGEANFASFTVRPMNAEALLDALTQVLEANEEFRRTPEGTRAAGLPGSGGESPFLKAFGKPDRLLSCDCERNPATTLSQALQMMNGESLRRKLLVKRNRIGRLLETGTKPDAMLEELTLAALCRFPTPSEKAAALALVKDAKNPREAWEDVAWSIVNSKEFLLIR
ncbi:MAG TPA: DUF1549 domain-containing protein [Planctomycetia bacterium]|nr:DUF1549 domain-containing protein [Planctomycetia bacterium]